MKDMCFFIRIRTYQKTNLYVGLSFFANNFNLFNDNGMNVR